MIDHCTLRYREFIYKLINRFRLIKYPRFKAFLSEFVGSAIYSILGYGIFGEIEINKILNPDLVLNYTNVGAVWGFAYTIGLYITQANGRGMMNPALTLAFALITKIEFLMVLGYTIAQLAGVLIGSLIVRILYTEKLALVDTISDSEISKNLTNKIFVTNYEISNQGAWLDLIVCTAVFTIGSLIIIEENCRKIPSFFQPFCIGLFKFSFINALSLNTGASINPAMNLSPSLMICITDQAFSIFSENNGNLVVLLAGPYIGAIVGSIIYEVLIGMHLDKAAIKFPKKRIVVHSDDDKKENLAVYFL